MTFTPLVLYRFLFGALRSGGALSVALVEALHATTGVYKLLLASEEWMALVAQFKREGTTLAGTSGELVAA